MCHRFVIACIYEGILSFLRIFRQRVFRIRIIQLGFFRPLGFLIRIFPLFEVFLIGFILFRGLRFVLRLLGGLGRGNVPLLYNIFLRIIP